MPSFATAGTLINDAATELGLITTAVANPYTSTDGNIVLLRQLLKSSGEDLLRVHHWTYLDREATLVTVGGQSVYALPADYYRLRDQTEWNRTNRLPVAGPIPPQLWQYLKARLVGVVFTVLFRIWEGAIHVYPDVDTPAGYTLAYEYMSNYWVQPTGQATGTTNTPTASTDTIKFDYLLMLRKLKLAWLKARGMPSDAAAAEYKETLQSIIEDDAPAPVLNLNKQRWVGDMLIGERNIPITGFGGT